jgi:hypothetical protein
MHTFARLSAGASCWQRRAAGSAAYARASLIRTFLAELFALGFALPGGAPFFLGFRMLCLLLGWPPELEFAFTN